jgi:hypothetical protein
MLYPFLIIEAKKEYKAPGFRYLEMQTAFPIRRLLKVQEVLRASSGADLDPLVWFFGYQGEEWRLYAGVLDGPKTVVYDLWHGTIQSEDGALQLFLIVEFIWSWARDIYHPLILRCVRGDTDNVARRLSASMELVNLSVSSSVTSPMQSSSDHTHTLSSTIIEELEDSDPMDLETEHGEDSSNTSTEDGSSAGTLNEWDREAGEKDNESRSLTRVHSTVQNADSHAFLRWTYPPFTESGIQCIIRHSNLVNFEFHRSFLLEGNENLNLPTEGHTLAHMREICHSVVLSRRQIYEIGEYWTGQPTVDFSEDLQSDYDQLWTAFFYCISSLKPPCWEIHRELYCIAYIKTNRSEPFTPISNDRDNYSKESKFPELIRALSSIRNLTGSDSVSTAFKEEAYVLSPDPGGPEWIRLPGHITGASFETKDIIYRTSTSFLHIHPPDGASQEQPISLLDDNDEIGMIVVRPSSWEAGAQFCLFVFSEECLVNDTLLSVILNRTIHEREFHFATQEHKLWSTEEKRALKAWMARMDTLRSF